MEGLPYDFGIEDDKDDDDSAETKTKKRPSILESLKQPETKAEDTKDTAEKTKEKLDEETEEDLSDIAPELDAEAPLKQPSRGEDVAIAQTMASVRLEEVKESDEEISSEALAAQSFLENAKATGDFERAENETLMELGEAPIALQPDLGEIETETAEPVDPSSLVEDARQVLTPNVSYSLNKANESPASVKPAPEFKPATPANPKAEKHTDRVRRGIVDYLVDRRFARLTGEHSTEEVQEKLNKEVTKIQIDLETREIRIRQIARSKSYEKPQKIKPAKAESIGKVLVDSEIPESEPVKGSNRELAGIIAHTMTHSDLLKVAERIKIEPNSLKRMYESHLIGEKGLRRVVAEYLRGGNFKKTLRRELIEREKDFERDPKLRDQASTQSVATNSNDLDDLLQRSGIAWSEPKPLLNQPKVKSSNLPALISDFKSPSNPLRRVVDVVMIGIIATLATVITVLILTR